MSMYPEPMVAPMRQELTSLGVQELKSPEEVDTVLGAKQGTVLVVINSVCGCAAGNARPGVRIALQNDVKPGKVVTVFAGVDIAATKRARDYITGFPPSSPSMALFKDGDLVKMIERHQIEGRMPQQIAFDLVQAFESHCKA